MIPVSALLAAILAATAPTDYPARIGMSAQSLHDIGVERLGDGNNVLHFVSSALFEDAREGVVNASARALTDDDAIVIGFFLGRNRNVTAIEYVGRSLAARDAAPARMRPTQ